MKFISIEKRSTIPTSIESLSEVPLVPIHMLTSTLQEGLDTQRWAKRAFDHKFPLL